MLSKKILPLCVISILLCLSTNVWATHLRAGYISVRQDDTNSLKFWITINIYLNTINTNVLFGGEDDFLDFGDGSDPDGDGIPGIMVPETPNTMRPDLGAGVAVASYTIAHTYPAANSYLISYSEPNRNAGIVNMNSSVSTRFYIETYIDVSSGSMYQTPTPLLPPIFHAMLGNEISMSVAAIDSNDFTLYYELTSCKKSRNEQADNYQVPENFTLNKFNGQIGWDTKFNNSLIPGEYSFAVRITQRDGDMVRGYMVYDFQIIVTDQDGSISIADDQTLDENGRIYIESTESRSVKVEASSESTTSLEVFSELLATPSAFSYSITDSSASGNIFKVGRITITNTATIDRENPYIIVARACIEVDNNRVCNDKTYLVYTRNVELPDFTTTAVDNSKGESETNLFPTYVNDVFFIESKTNIKTVTIRSSCGNLISQITKPGNSIDVRDLKPGIYLIYLGGSSRTFRRIVKL